MIANDPEVERVRVPLFRAPSELEAQVKVQPMRVVPFEQIDFPVAFPFLELFFAAKRVGRIFVGLAPNQPIDPVPLGKAGNEFVPVLPNTPRQIRGRTDIESSVRFAG
jgi:hypothetical protein